MSSNPGDTGQTVGFSFECVYIYIYIFIYFHKIPGGQQTSFLTLDQLKSFVPLLCLMTGH